MNAADTGTAAVPVTFGACFGWYHPASPSGVLARGVVLCPPFGVEALWSHRNLGVLARMLAAAGVPVLRFDYPGTGDSPGGEAPDLLAQWCASVVAAVGFLRRLAGTDDVALCGVRLGGLLAAEALRPLSDTRCRLALLAPIVSGSAYAHELVLWGRMRGRPQHPDRVEVAGFSLHASDMRRLETLDLKAAMAAVAPSAVLALDTAADRLRDDAWCARMAAAGTVVSIAPWTGYTDFMRETHLAAAPLPVFARVVAFLAEGAAPAPRAITRQNLPGACVRIDGGTTVEVPVTFGRAKDLFGILCAPGLARDAATEGRPAVVILNTGSNHRIGDARYAVLLARNLATHGIASLRVDLGGVGDSPRADDERLLGGGPDAYRRASLRLYGRSHMEDVRSALDTLEARGFGPFFLVGICSGARAALDMALADPRVAGLALGNLPSFERNPVPDDADDATPALAAAPVPVPYRLARALLGQRTRYWLTHVARQTDRAVEHRVGRAVAPIAQRIGIGRAASATHALQTLSRRKTDTLLIYSRDDPTFAELEVCFGAQGRGLGGINGVRCVVIDGKDHSFSTSEMRDHLIACVEQQVCATLLPTGGTDPEGDRDPSARDQSTSSNSRSSLDAARVSRITADLIPAPLIPPRDQDV